MPKFTYCAIIPNHDDGKTFGEAFNSIIRQTHPFDQIIVVDDGSTDDSVELIERCIRDCPSVKFLPNKVNLGTVRALNLGIEACRTDFVLLCASKDTYEPKLVEHCDAILQKFPDAGAVCGSIEKCDEEGSRSPDHLRLPPGFRSPEELLDLHRSKWPQTVYYHGGASLLRTDFVRRFGGLNPELKWHSDIILYHLVAFHSGVAVSREVFRRNVGSDDNGYSATGMKDWKQQREVIRSIVEFVKLHREGEYFKQSGNLPWFFVDKTKGAFCKDIKLIWYLFRQGYLTPRAWCKAVCLAWARIKSKFQDARLPELKS
jgi:glycosyltransferase involved in cell wall biosynthesis